MLYFREGNLVKDQNIQVFCHQCNCRGKMGAGIAKQIADTYPVVAKRDADYCHTNDNVLGTILPVKVSVDRICVNMYAQENYGRGRKQTDYDAFEKCLNELARFLKENVDCEASVGFPDHIGCGLAGGNWDKVMDMLSAFSEEVTQNIYVVRIAKHAK